LRLFLIGCVIIGIAVALLIRSFQSHLRYQESISGVWNNSASGDGYAFNLIGYLNHRDQPVAFILWVIEDEVPQISFSYGYDANVGGTLTVEGEKLEPADSPWLFVGGPYGHTMKLELNEAETKQLLACRASNKAKQRIYQFWHDVVEARIYQTEGKSRDGRREGKWVFRLHNGDKYMEGNYQNGERDGPWIKYYPGGNLRAQLNYAAGKASGIWTYFGEDGNQLASESASNYRYWISNAGGMLKIGDVEIPVIDLPADVRTVFPQGTAASK
jgi:hypothetical protein